MSSLTKQLDSFAESHKMRRKGSLCLALVVTRNAKENGLPLDKEALLTDSQGQVAGLSKPNVQSILLDHGIERVLAEEGGRTNRGNILLMQSYVDFLNDLVAPSLEEIEAWWIAEVQAFFESKPFVLHFDASKSLRSIIQDLLSQADIRQKSAPGTTYVGAVMQHLVGAKLDLVLDGLDTHHGSCVADSGTGRDADFMVGDTSVHVTSSPSEALIRKCQRNLEHRLYPLIVTTESGCAVAHGLAAASQIEDRVDVLSIDQFLASNIYEHGRFDLKGRVETTKNIIKRYNEIVDKCETDPSLRIDFS